MKKTLFAMAALALCGTAVAGTYNASDYTEFQPFSQYNIMEAVTLNVSQDVTYTYLVLNTTSSTTLNFTGTGIISVTNDLSLCTTMGSNAVTGEGSAVTYWESELLKATEAPAVVTLISRAPTASYQNTVNSNLTFMGESKNGSVTLGDTDLTYLGAFTVSSLDEAKALITSDNQIAVAYVAGSATDNGLFLVGKATATTPEPATATLSLLALAGLASRRRRK